MPTTGDGGLVTGVGTAADWRWRADLVVVATGAPGT